jgi:hypothetical protein
MKHSYACLAGAYALAYPVRVQPINLKPNPENDEDGDLVFGHLTATRNGQFNLAGPLNEPNNSDLYLVNAVRVMTRRTRARGNAAGRYWGRLLGRAAALRVTPRAMVCSK